MFDDLTFFDLRKLEEGNSYQIGRHYFNFCKRLEDTNGAKTFAYLDLPNSLEDQSVRLTDGGRPVNVKTIVNTESDTAQRHISFELDGGEACATNSSRNYTVKYEITCDASATAVPTLNQQNLDLLTDTCSPKLTFAHSTGCPVFAATSIVRFFAENPWLLGILLIIFGSIVTFYGGKYFPWVLATVTGGMTFMVVLLFASVLGFMVALDKGKNAHGGEIAMTVLSFLVAGAAGVLAGLFIKAIQRIGITILGTVAGFFAGFLLYTFVFAQWLQHVALLCTLCGFCAITLGYLAYRYDKVLIVYLTAFLGSYAFVRGISMFAGKYPNEIFLYQQLSNNAFDGLTWEFYLYLASMAALGVMGVVHQFKKGYHKHHDEYDGHYQKA